MDAHIKLLEAQAAMQSTLAEAIQLAAKALELAVLPKLRDIIDNPAMAYEKLEKQVVLERLFEDITSAVQLSSACIKNIDEMQKLREKLGVVQSEAEYTQALRELLYGPGS